MDRLRRCTVSILCGFPLSLPRLALEPLLFTRPRGGDVIFRDAEDPDCDSQPAPCILCGGMLNLCFWGKSICDGGASRTTSFPLSFADSLRDIIGGVMPPGGEGLMLEALDMKLPESACAGMDWRFEARDPDRKSTRLNSSHWE